MTVLLVRHRHEIVNTLQKPAHDCYTPLLDVPFRQRGCFLEISLFQSMLAMAQPCHKVFLQHQHKPTS
jgi:hypothetical protein